MSMLGSTCIIANPVAQSGACARIAKEFTALLANAIGERKCELIFTEHPGHASLIASTSHSNFDTVIVIGGDGAVHETVNGLMRIDEGMRPKLGVVPVGSGNDYAYTLGMSENPKKALKQILYCDTQKLDIGNVNGHYFVETLSFGIDAAIALATVESRKKNGQSGSLLYLEAGINELAHNLKLYDFEAVVELPVPGEQNCDLDACFDAQSHTVRAEIVDREKHFEYIEGVMYLFTIQIGATYGGHFKVTPAADPTDGLFDICIAYPPLSPRRALGLFVQTRVGAHLNSKNLEFLYAKNLDLSFKANVPCQIDGEKLTGTNFNVSILPRSLEVILGKSRPWSEYV